MTSEQIIQQADKNRIFMGDVGTLDYWLRFQVIPAFLEDVARLGSPYWLYKPLVVNATAEVQTVDLPADFFWLEYLAPGPRYDKGDSLTFIGEDPAMVVGAEATTTRQRPTAYYIVPDDDGEYKRLKWDRIPDTDYAFGGRYRVYWPFVGETEFGAVDLRAYFPVTLHWALVSALRKQILFDRYGDGDQRYQAEFAEYQRWVERCAFYEQPAQRNYVRVAR